MFGNTRFTKHDNAIFRVLNEFTGED